jgi:glycerol kinase
MSGADLLLAVDQGTTSTKALLVGNQGDVVRVAAAPLSSSYPQPGWVEQSADEIVTSARRVVADVLEGIDPSRVLGVCLSTQRESVVLWDADTGAPLGPLVSWQDQRTIDLCRALRRRGADDHVWQLTGLPLDPMFSGSRATWLLDAVDPERTRARAGELRLGTVDSWLLTQLTGEHLTEPGNASRTQLMNLRDRSWDAELLDLFSVPAQILPRIVPSRGPFGTVRGLEPLLDGTPVLSVLGDSHAALFAHGAWTSGSVKATYGTGSSVMGVCEPDFAVPSGLCRTVAWDCDGPTYALEGNIRASGATVAWVARTLGRSPAELAELARTVPDSAGVTLVPAFNGLGAPWWDPDAVGLITGLTLGSQPAHIARASLESVAHQVEDVLAAMAPATGRLDDLLADGGASSNADLMQLQADVSGRQVHASTLPHLSPLGAAHLGGIACGLWTKDDLIGQPRTRTTFVPRLTDEARLGVRKSWKTALVRARTPVEA